MSQQKLYTKAQITEEQLLNLFGIEFGVIESDPISLQMLEDKVNIYYSQQEIIDLTIAI